MNENDNKKNIEIVNGDGKDLDISAVFEHLEAAKPKMKEHSEKEIVIPKGKTKEKKENSDEDDENTQNNK